MEKFRVKFPCKPYVRRYMEITFGNPADLSKDKALHDIFRAKLRKTSFRYEKRFANPDRYGAEIDIKISRDDFYRYGWELSATDTAALNSLIAGHAKTLLYKTVGLYMAFNYKLTECIGIFQTRYRFTEDVWPQDSIYKDCRRNLKVHRGDMNSLVAEYVKKFDLDSLLVK